MEINKAIQLYDMMAKRFEACGVAPNQAKVYAETRDYISDCATPEEAMKKIKGSKYYTAPAQALMLDKMYAYKRAAVENKMMDLADVYDKKYKEIEADWMKAYETGYETIANGIEAKHGEKMEKFSAIFNTYINMLCTGLDQSELSRLQGELKDAFSRLNALGANFAELAGDERFKRLIPATEAAFNRFITEAQSMLNTLPDRSAEKAEFQAEYSRLWPIIQSKKSEIISVGQDELARTKKRVCVAIPPKDATGKYTFDMFEEEV